MTKIIAITGGIGSGKTTLTKHLVKQRYKVHDSDNVVLNLYKKPTKMFISFIKGCGLKNILKGKKINKTVIVDKIFDNTHLKKKFEKHIHKEVKKSRTQFIKKNFNKKNKIIFADIPLLFENNLEHHFDITICIVANKKIRMKRVLDNKKFTKETFNKIIKNQTTDKERKTRSNILIYNNKTKKDFILMSQKVLIEILK
mgnify:CR=1 FL=1